MNNLNPFVLLALSVATSAIASPELSPVTLGQALKAADQKNENVGITSAQAQETDAQVSQARSAVLPTLTYNGNYTRQKSYEPGPNPESGYMRFTLSQPLFQGFKEYAGMRSANDLNGAQAATFQATRIAVQRSVVSAFYAVLSDEQYLRDLREELDLSKKRVTENTAFVRIGRAREGDLLSAQADVATVEATIGTAEVSLDQDRDAFALETGLERMVALEDDEPLPPAVVPLDESLQKIEGRPDVVAQRLQLANAEEGVTIAKAGHWPTAAGLADYYTLKTGTQKDATWDVGVGFTFPLFEGGLVSAQVRQASWKEKEYTLRFEQSRRQAIQDVTSAWHAADGFIREMPALRAAVVANQKNYEYYRHDYSLGLATNLDVITALRTLMTARITADKTYYQAKSAVAILKAAIAESGGV